MAKEKIQRPKLKPRAGKMLEKRNKSIRQAAGTQKPRVGPRPGRKRGQ